MQCQSTVVDWLSHSVLDVIVVVNKAGGRSKEGVMYRLGRYSTQNDPVPAKQRSLLPSSRRSLIDAIAPVPHPAAYSALYIREAMGGWQFSYPTSMLTSWKRISTETSRWKRSASLFGSLVEKGPSGLSRVSV